MKKNLLTIISTLTLSLFVSISMAQIGKGTSLIGGSVYFSSQTSQINSTGGEVKNKNFNVSPSYGIAVKDNFIVGGDLRYGNSRHSLSDYNKNAYGIGIFARKYYNLGSSGFYFFAQTRLGAGFEHADGRYNPDNAGGVMSKEKGLNITLGIQPGIAYALTPKIQLETGLNNLLYAGYAKTETKAGGTTVQKQSGFNASASFAEALQWNIGFRLLLGGS